MKVIKITALILFGLSIGLTVTWWITPTSAIIERDTEYLDMHVHTAGLGYGDSGAFVNDDMRNSYKFRFYLSAMNVTLAELESHGDAIVIEKIAAAVRESKRVSNAVVLAMDGVIDERGKLDRRRTQIYVPNDFVLRETARHPELLYGASINPYRADAISRLRQAKANGAVLLKWIPNIMLIDPQDPRLERFYTEMAALDLPLLSHAGQERSFAGADDRLGDPLRLRYPLSLGVTVIAAHIATTGENDGISNYERIIPMFAEYPNLYSEISSLTQANKRNYLVDALRRRELDGRLLFGSDWPLQFASLVSPIYQADHLTIGQIKAILIVENQWDRDVALKEALGVPLDIFERSAALLRPR